MSGLLAEFTDARSAAHAADALRAQAVAGVETHTPYATEDPGRSVLPLVVLVAGLLGAAGAFAMQWYANAVSYPLDIGGRPQVAWPAFMPMVFEVGILSAVASGVLGFLVACGMPALYDEVDEVDAFRRATRDGFFVVVRSDDVAAIDRARALLTPLQPRVLTDFAT